MRAPCETRSAQPARTRPPRPPLRLPPPPHQAHRYWLRCRLVLHWPVLHWPVLHWPVLHWPVLHWPVLHWPVLHWPVLHWPVLLWPVLHCPVLHWPVLHWPVLHWPVLRRTPQGRAQPAPRQDQARWSRRCRAGTRTRCCSLLCVRGCLAFGDVLRSALSAFGARG